MGKKKSSKKEDQEQFDKIKSLQEMIATAERTIMSAKQMLTQLQVGGASQPSGVETFSSQAEGQVVHGTFDGQIMIGEDGKQYPVPANYASKSKLIEGDMLKLTITADGSFVYKQIGPIERKFIIGITEKDDRNNFVVNAEGTRYKLLLAAATYFKTELGDEVTIVVPKNQPSVWAAVENVVRKASEVVTDPAMQRIQTVGDAGIEKEEPAVEETFKRPSAIEKLEKEIEEERKQQVNNDSVLDEWTPDIEQLKKEAGHPAGAQVDDTQFEK